ncbi:hypothetical protein TNCV_4621831 [Trichonephila clavipes]|nr:hypothetical protein TNCV_4621831 [Trichonephila clavipes]
MKLRRITNSYNKFTEIIESTSGGKKLVKIRWPINVESLERQSYDLSLSDILGTQKDHMFYTRDGEPLARVPFMARITIFWARQRSKWFAFYFKITNFTTKYYEQIELLRIVGIGGSELWRQPRPVTGCYASVSQTVGRAPWGRDKRTRGARADRK